MVNNDFHVIGTAITDFNDITGNCKYKIYMVVVEVEKLGGNGGHFEIPVVFYQTNRVIDPTMRIKGKSVVINGYVDSYKSEKNIIVKVVGQNLYVVDKDEY